jgi:spermidine synthase
MAAAPATSYTFDAELHAAINASKSYTESACTADTHSVYALESCLWAGRTPYCEEVVIAKSPTYGTMLFLEKEIQSSSSDEAIYHEHLVHPVMAATHAHTRVLIVGGGEGATAREVLKYSSVLAVDWVDIDAPLVDLCRRHLGYASDAVYNDPRLQYIAADIRTFLAKTEHMYSVIILDLPDPDLEEVHAADALYSVAFFRLLKQHLAPGGAIVSHAGPVAPGDARQHRPALQWIRDAAHAADLPADGEKTYAYHTCLPSFQGEWGFWMTCAPAEAPRFPEDARIMNAQTQTYACTWPAHWGE